MEIPALPLPEGYSFKTSMNFKKGKFSIFANLFVLFGMIVGFATLFLLFDYSFDANKPLEFLFLILIRLLIFIGILLTFIIINPVIQMIFYKACGGGKVKLHIGLMVEIYCEKPITRNVYLLALLFSYIIPLVILTVFAIFFWSDVMYLSLIMVACNFISYIPVIVFILKQNKSALAHFKDGTLNMYAKNGK